jgi:hypothetical protein
MMGGGRAPAAQSLALIDTVILYKYTSRPPTALQVDILDDMTALSGLSLRIIAFNTQQVVNALQLLERPSFYIALYAGRPRPRPKNHPPH